MTGITPAWLTFIGMYVDAPPYTRRPAIRFAYWTGMRRCACSMNTMNATMDDDHDDRDRRVEEPLVPVDGQDLAGNDRDHAGEDQHRHAVADAAVGDQLAHPHDDRGAGHHRDHHGGDGEDRAVRDQRVSAAGPHPLNRVPDRASSMYAGGLQDGQPHGEVPGVLGDLGLPGLALLLERLQPRDHDGQQLQDDAGGDVRHDAEREHRQVQQRLAAEQVDDGRARPAVGLPAAVARLEQ